MPYGDMKDIRSISKKIVMLSASTPGNETAT